MSVSGRTWEPPTGRCPHTDQGSLKTALEPSWVSCRMANRGAFLPGHVHSQESPPNLSTGSRLGWAPLGRCWSTACLPGPAGALGRGSLPSPSVGAALNPQPSFLPLLEMPSEKGLPSSLSVRGRCCTQCHLHASCGQSALVLPRRQGPGPGPRPAPPYHESPLKALLKQWLPHLDLGTRCQPTAPVPFTWWHR